MARPTSTGKQSINLAPPGPRVSRIRRDPPPAVKAKIVVDPEERDRRDMAIGILTFALAIFVIIFAFGSYAGRSLSEYSVKLKIDE